ncbi:MAG: hypothetical protein ABI203_08810 [Mucilaginibacter sp.]
MKEKTIIMQTAGINQVLQLFNRLSKTEQLELVEQISKQTFEERWQSIDVELPNVNFSEEDIMKEVSAIRYSNKK